MNITQLDESFYEFVIPSKEITYADAAYCYKLKLSREELEGLYHEIREHIIYN